MKALFERITELRKTSPPSRKNSKTPGSGWEDVDDNSPSKDELDIKVREQANDDDEGMVDSPKPARGKSKAKAKDTLSKSPEKKEKEKKTTKVSPMKVLAMKVSGKPSSPKTSPKKVIKDNIEVKSTSPKGKTCKESKVNPKALPKEDTPIKYVKKNAKETLDTSGSGEQSSSSGRDAKSKQLHQENLKIMELMVKIGLGSYLFTCWRFVRAIPVACDWY